MAKTKEVFVCSSCGNESAKWNGKCFACNEWNTMVEEVKMTGKAKSAAVGLLDKSDGKAIPVQEVSGEESKGFDSGIDEFNRVLGGKIFSGSVVLFAGEPGKGKSTLLLQVTEKVAQNVGKALYASGEENTQQIKSRWERIGGESSDLLLIHAMDIDRLEKVIEDEEPCFVVVDSIQRMMDANVSSQPGSVSQVSACTIRLAEMAKTKNIPIFIVGQVLKDNSIAGPRELEHMVDTVLYLEGDDYQDLRYVRPIKNRFGETNELAVFTMRSEGMVEVPNPSEYLLAHRQKGESGTSIICISDTRPLFVEAQALVSAPIVPNMMPKRTAEGFQRNRLSILTAILEKRLNKHRLSQKEIFVNIVSGMNIQEPGADLGVAMAILSSELEKPIEKDDQQICFIGELGLTGELRPVGNIEQMVKEAERVGFTHCVIPKPNYELAKKRVDAMELVPFDHLNQVVKQIFPPSKS